MNVFRSAIVILPALALVVAACSQAGGSGSPPPSTDPTPTPVGSTAGGPVTNLDEAAAAVIASDSRFSGVTRLNPDMIGANAWWEGEPTETGYAIRITIGWGDCPAGCIYRHVWHFSVTPDGNATLDSETGDPLPPGSMPA